MFAAVPIYVRHYLGTSATGSSWQQTLAAAMHSRIRAIQQQSLPPAVVSAKHNPPPLLPLAHPACRLLSVSAYALVETGNASRPGRQVAAAQGSLQHIQAASPLAGLAGLPVKNLRQRSGNCVSGHKSAEDALVVEAHASTSYVGAVPQSCHSRLDQDGHQNATYADVLMAKAQSKLSKRKVPDVQSVLQESQLPVKRHQNGGNLSLSSLQEQSKQLQQLIAQSRATNKT